jgi:predicted transposase YbfD/YdcC
LSQGHGRHETREVYPFAVTPEQTGFPYAAQAALILRTTHHLKSRTVTEELELALTSRPNSTCNSAQLQTARRGHWGIETRLHYVRDVTFGEDLSTVRTGHSPRNLATLRNLVIGLCALDAARHGKTASFLPSFRRRAQNDRSLALALVTESLLDGR